jgi:molybdopterin molybdotransferase
VALLPVETALERILNGVKPLPTENVSLRDAYGRVTSKPVIAKRDQPPFDASAMDGYAVRSSDIEHAPVELRLIGTSAAGHCFKGKLSKGEAVRILTGAPLPSGADTVVIQENTQNLVDTIRILQSASRGRNVRLQGLDFSRNAELVPSSTQLNARDIGLIAAGGHASVKLRRKPQVSLLTTGDELVMPGVKPRSDQIVSSNSFALDLMLQAMGAQVRSFGIVKDTLKETEKAIRSGLGSDLLITTGGASVGDHDFVQKALQNCGVKIDFWKIALRPGKPLMFGTKGRTRIIGLPGNPVSALVCARIFVKPLINAMLGLPTAEQLEHATLEAPMPENDNRKDYVRATLSMDTAGSLRVKPSGMQDSSMQRTLRDADCLIIREPHAKAASVGESVLVMKLDF